MEKTTANDKGKNQDNNENHNDPRDIHLAEVDNSPNESDILKENESLSNDVQVNEPAEDFSKTSKTSVLSEEVMNEVDEDFKNNTDKEGQKSDVSAIISEIIQDSEENNEVMEEKNDSAKLNNLNDIQERVTKAPSLFSISKKYGTSDFQYSAGSSQFRNFVSKNKRKVEDIDKAMAFENSLYVSKKRKIYTFTLLKKFGNKTNYL